MKTVPVMGTDTPSQLTSVGRGSADFGLQNKNVNRERVRFGDK